MYAGDLIRVFFGRTPCFPVWLSFLLLAGLAAVVFWGACRFHARWLVVSHLPAALAGGFLLLGGLRGEFLPLMDDGRIMAKVKLPVGASVQETDRTPQELERHAAGDSLVESTFCLASG